MDLLKLNKILKEHNQKPFRKKQILRAVFKRLINSWDEASDISKDMKEVLKKELSILDLELIKKQTSKDGTVKALFKLPVRQFRGGKDGLCVESVLMSYENGRNTLCISSMAGCPMGCKFCATGEMGYQRKLTAGEMCDQVLFFVHVLNMCSYKNFSTATKKDLKIPNPKHQILNKFQIQNSNDQNGLNSVSDLREIFCNKTSFTGSSTSKFLPKIDNVVIMGMGEPFLNYDNVMEAVGILNDSQYGFGIGSRKISISTCGIPDKIRQFAEEPFQANLAISLHSANDKIRSEIMPVNKKYSLEEVMEAVEYYVKKTNRKVMFEYLLIKDVNDSPEDAEELARLMKNSLYHVNLIKYHGSTGGFKPSSSQTRQNFFDVLKKKGVSVTTRMSFGEDIEAACGQLKANQES